VEKKMNLTRLDIEQVKPEMPGDLQEIAGQLLLSARKLPHGPGRQKNPQRDLELPRAYRRAEEKDEIVEAPQKAMNI
jgi:hypothetical protein